MSVGFHHVELWLADGISVSGWPWLLEQVGFVRMQSWEGRESWAAGGAYLTLTTLLTLPTLPTVQNHALSHQVRRLRVGSVGAAGRSRPRRRCR